MCLCVKALVLRYGFVVNMVERWFGHRHDRSFHITINIYSLKNHLFKMLPLLVMERPTPFTFANCHQTVEQLARNR